MKDYSMISEQTVNIMSVYVETIFRTLRIRPDFPIVSRGTRRLGMLVIPSAM